MSSTKISPWLCALLLSYCDLLIGQQVIDIIDPVYVLEINHLSGKITIGPNPESTGKLYELLKLNDVQTDLGFNDVHKDVLSDYIMKELRMLADGKGAGEVRKARLALMEELLTPLQTLRLTQIAYRIEVSTLGLAVSLTEGRLRDKVGLYDNQLTRIKEKGEQIESAKKDVILGILEQAEKDLLSSLEVDQRKAVEDAIGKYFYCDEGDFASARRVVGDSANNRALNRLAPSNALYLFSLLSFRAVQRELELSEKDMMRIDTCRKERQSTLETRRGMPIEKILEMEKDEVAKLESLLSQVLNEPQLQRLKQLANRSEISVLTLGGALTNGRLREFAKLRMEQLDALQRLNTELGKRVAEDIISTEGRSESQLLSELSPEQRDRADAVIGKPFVHSATSKLNARWKLEKSKLQNGLRR